MWTTVRQQAERWLAPALVLAVILARVRFQDQWDFDVYYFAALADRHGLSPYDASHLSAMTPGAVFHFPYMYPPPTVALFKPLTFISVNAAKALWMTLNATVLVALVALWQARFVRNVRRDGLVWALFLILGFNSALVREIRSGNFELIVELLVWSGLAAFLLRRWGIFCGLIVTAAFFKLTPLLLLMFLVALCVPGRGRWLAAGLLGLAVLLGLSWAIAPADFHQWIMNVSGHDEEMGMGNPSTLALCREVADYFSIDATQGRNTASIAYLILAALIGAVSLRTVWRARRPSLSDDRLLELMFFGLITYAIVLPRFMVYAYILLLVPAYFIVRGSRIRVVSLLCLFAVHDVADKLLGTPINPNDPFWSQASPLTLTAIWLGYVVVNYFSWFLALGLWVLFRRSIATWDDQGQVVASPSGTVGT